MKEDAAPAGRPEMGPIGFADEVTVLLNIQDRVRESREQSTEWNKKADRNKVMFAYGEDPKPPDSKIVFNGIRSEIKSSVNQQTREPATIKLKPVETNDPGQFYSFDPNQPDPIDPALAQALMQPQPVADPETGQAAVDPMTGQPAMQPGMQLFKMDDKAVADFWQRQFDVHFRRGKLWPAFRRVAFDAAIFGFKFPVYEFNVQTRTAKLWTSISVWDTHTDSVGVDNFEECQFFGVDWLLESGQARSMFPEIADQIREWARPGNPSKGGQVMLGGGKDRRFDRNMIILRHFWIRNQPILLTKDEVMQSGALPTQQVPTGNPMMGPDGMPTIDEATQQPQMEMMDQLAPDPLTGEPPSPVLHGDDGAMSHNPDWPTRMAIRHIVVLPELNKLLVDEECAYSDIPAGWTPGDPVPGQLFGTGYPESFNAPQMAENQFINAAVQYVKQFPSPGCTVPSDVGDAIAAGLKGHMLTPADMLKIPPIYWEKYKGDVLKWNVPPTLPPAMPQVMEIIKEKRRETAVNPEVTSGKQPGQVTGWQSLQLLQQAAASQYDFPMQWFTECIERVATLHLNALVKWLSVQDLMAVCSEYPEHIVMAFQQRAQAAEWNIDAQLSSTVGMQRAKERAEAMESHQVVSPVTGRAMLSDRTMTERFNEDYEEEQRRQDEEMASPAAMQFAAAQQAAAEPAGEKGKGGGKEPAGSNGNGHGGRFGGE